MYSVLFVSATGSIASSSSLIAVLRTAGYDPLFHRLDPRAPDGIEALQISSNGRPPDLVVVDSTQNLDMQPLRQTRKLMRQAWGESLPLPPFLGVITQRQLDAADLPAYVDDVALAPINESEVVMRLRLLLFRAHHRQKEDKLSLPGFTVDLAAGVARGSDGRPIPFTPREYELLRFLLVHQGKVFSRSSLLNMVWGVDYDGGERTVDIHVRRLRAKLPSVVAQLIETRRGTGYGLRSPDELA